MKFENIYSEAIIKKEMTKRASRLPMSFDLSKLIRMGFNEHPHGMSPKVLTAIKEADNTSNFYGDFMASDLKKNIADYYGYTPDNIITGAGSSAIINIIGTTFLDKGDEVLMCPTFAAFLDMVGICQAKSVIVPLNEDMTYNLEGLLEGITDKTKMIIVCNPNNPTGTYVGKDALTSFIDKVPDDIVLLFDEAYIEFATADDCESMIPQIEERADKPIIVLRTFSKYYGMAGVRVGYGVASEEIIQMMSKSPLNMVSKSGQAGAIAALEDQEYYQWAKEEIVNGVNYIEKGLEDLGCTVYHSQTNFIMFDPHVDHQELRLEIIRRGIMINTPMLCRVSVGKQGDNEKFIIQMREALEQIG